VKLRIFTLAYEAIPFIERHLPVFEQLNVDWHWIIVHGPSNNGGSTNWCQPQGVGLSTDGTTEYLRAIRARDRVTVIEKKSWPSKDMMCNAALSVLSAPPCHAVALGVSGCVLFQIDADEFWRPDQLETVIHLFAERPQLSSIQFPCRYFVGPNLILRGEHCYGDHDFEWLRAWRYTPGRKFISHEPPVLEGDDPAHRLSKTESRSLGLVFDHHAYATEDQCRYKEAFYGYRGLVNQWRALQHYDQFPVALSRFFSHVKGNQCDVIKISC
jgi:hypothetical protein